MHIIGLTGPIGSGKTTFAEFLNEQVQPSAHWESWQIIAEVAEILRAQSFTPAPDDYEAINKWLLILPEATQQVTGERADYDALRLNEEQVVRQPENYTKLFEYLGLVQAHPELAHTPIALETKETFRNILQWIGGPVAASVNQAMWYQEIVRRIQGRPELQLATVGGVRYPADAATLRDAGGLVFAIKRPSSQERDTQDPTERDRNAIEADTIIVNNGSLEELHRAAKRVLEDLQTGTLQPQYRAKSK